MKGLYVLSVVVSLLSYAAGQGGLQVDFGDSNLPFHGDEISASGFLSPSAPVSSLDDQSQPWRLPRHVFPTMYQLTISPILNETVDGLGTEFTAPGNVKITVRADQSSDNITLHLADTNYITAENWKVTHQADPTENLFDSIESINDQMVVIKLIRPLEQNETYLIEVDFVANIISGLDGLYRSSYIDPYTGTTKWLATTQMEALHARQMFPCFDEPAFRAVFKITIGRHKDRVALTTTETDLIRPMPGITDWVFEEFTSTRITIPTYLLALIVSEFTFDEANSTLYRGRVRTYAPPHFIDQNGGVYAAEKAAMMLQHFETYYNQRYGLSKMDSAAVPDFFFGAMENYGLNIYRESALLYMPEESTEDERFRITRILAHELGHQWFGNLVTPAWWTHIWLNEGFATYVAAQGAHHTSPEFQAWERYQNDAVQNAMGFDARSDYSHSVKIDDIAWKARPAMDWFDRMAYEKAGSLILMMKGFLGEDVLKVGLLDYLNVTQYSYAEQDNLFERLNAAAVSASKLPQDLTMKDIMDTWTLQPGFPLIRVSVADSQNVFVSQERFLNNDPVQPGHVNQNSGLWNVPLFISKAAAPAVQVDWLRKDVAMRRVQTNTSQWFVVNAGADVFYRVIYDTSLTQLIKKELETNHGFISSRTRSQLLDDYFNAAWQKHINLETALSLAEYLGSETEIVVWNSVLNNFRKPFNILSNTGSLYIALRDFLLPRLKSAVALTGGLNDTTLPETMGGMPVIRHLQFMDWLCAFEDPECLSLSTELVGKWMAAPENNMIRRDIKPVVYCSAISAGGDPMFNFIHAQYMLKNITAKQQGTLLNSLACTKDISLIKELLEQSLLDNGFYNATGHGLTAMTQLAKNPFARAEIRKFLSSIPNLTGMLNRFGVGAVPSVINALATYLSTQDELDQIKTLITNGENVHDGLTERTRGAIRTIEQNIAWVADFGEVMSTFVSKL